MQLTTQHIEEFTQQGFTSFGQVFSEAEMARAAEALERIHRDTPKFISSLREPELLPLLHDPRVERIAQHLLGTDTVIHSGNTSLYKSPGSAGDTWKMAEREHVDIMYSLDEFDARPRRMTCMLMIFVSDVPAGCANTFIRPGSHRMLARHLAESGQEPVKAQPVHLDKLPDLNWPEPQPIIGKRGHVVAFSTSLVHSGSNNVTPHPRHMVFSNFCPLGLLKDVTGNHDRRAERETYRIALRDLFPSDRQHLLQDSFLE